MCRNNLPLARFLSILLLIFPFLSAARPAARQTLPPFTIYTINSMADTTDGLCNASNCTLREAILAANTDGTESGIYFQSGITSGTITLAASLPPISESFLTAIVGHPSRAIIISGADLYQILTVNPGASLGLRHLTFAHGKSTTPGGAISNAGTLSIQYCDFTNNESTAEGGAISNSTPGVVDIFVGVFYTNKSPRGAAIRNASSVNNSGAGTMTINLSFFQANEASSEGGAIYNTGGADAILLVNDTYFSWNISEGSGGAIHLGGGAATVENTTLYRNHAVNGAALASGTGGSLTVRNATIAENSASAGGSVQNAGGSLALRNTIVANPAAGTNCSGVITNSGNNIDSLASCGWGSSRGSLSNTDPLLTPLLNSGGTDLFGLYWPSPAVDGVTDDPLDCPSTDQRGSHRPVDGDLDGVALCDIGAYESQYQYFLYIPLLRR